MEKLWAGKFHGQLDQAADDFNASIRVDRRMAAQDIQGSLAHGAMLTRQGILSQADGAAIAKGLESIAKDLESGRLQVDTGCEDIHTFIEAELTRRIGDAGKRLHTARSRNDQVALDLRLTLRTDCSQLQAAIAKLIQVLCDKAEAYADTIMPGYTHMQRAQPITFGQHLMAYAMMLLRDKERLGQCAARMNVSPLGCCALAGTTYDTDRLLAARLLDMDGICQNSLDGVSDRDFCLELAADLSILMMHLSRMSEEIILWCSWEFGFVALSDAYSTGSSIMPQKKNPDIAELIRGKTGRVYGDLMSLLTVMKGLPLAYNKDMQEDKEPVFDAVDTVEMCLPVFAAMLDTMTVRTDNMRKAAGHGFINATDCADYLTKKGMPFRDAYTVTGHLVAQCTARGKTLEELTLEELKAVSELFEADVYDALNLENCMALRSSYGGPAVAETARQIGEIEQFIQKIKENR